MSRNCPLPTKSLHFGAISLAAPLVARHLSMSDINNDQPLYTVIKYNMDAIEIVSKCQCHLLILHLIALDNLINVFAKYLASMFCSQAGGKPFIVLMEDKYMLYLRESHN